MAACECAVRLGVSAKTDVSVFPVTASDDVYRPTMMVVVIWVIPAAVVMVVVPWVMPAPVSGVSPWVIISVVAPWAI